MGLRLGHINWVVGKQSFFSSLFVFLGKSIGAQFVSSCLAGKYWELPLLFV